MLLYNINRPVEPPHNYNLKPFHNHHGNSPARSSFPGRAVSSRHKCLFKKKSEKFKKSVDNYRAREYNIRVLATIAQLAEHLIRNERVVGSNPISGSNKIKASEKSEAFFLCIMLLILLLTIVSTDIIAIFHSFRISSI